MRKILKAITSMTLASVLVFSSISGVFAIDDAREISQDTYDIYSISFPQTKANIDSYTMNDNNNIDQAITFVQSLNLSDRGVAGLEDAYINELETMAEEGTNLETYAIYLPKSDAYYGTYDGYKFRASFSVYNESYQKTLTGKANHEKWVSGIFNILMSFVDNRKISFGYAVFASLSGVSDIRYYDGAWTDITISDEVTSRYIWIEDKDHKVSYHPDSYVIVINDMARVTRPVLVTYPNSPYGDPQVQATFPIETVTSTNFYNSTSNMSRGFRHYVSGDISNYIRDIVPHATLSWQ